MPNSKGGNEKMTTQGVIVLNLIGLFLLIWLFNLIRKGLLYVGYGIIFIIATVATMVTVSIPPLLMFVTHLVGAIFPASALTLLAFGFIVFALVYILTQLTIISNRVSALVQEIAIREAKGKETKNEGAGRPDKESQTEQ